MAPRLPEGEAQTSMVCPGLAPGGIAAGPSDTQKAGLLGGGGLCVVRGSGLGRGHYLNVLFTSQS